MLRCLAPIATTALLGAGMLAALPASAVSAAEPWQRYSFVNSLAEFTRMGRVPGQVGNAHTGSVSFDTSDDPVTVILTDWNCPAGKTPPRAGLEYDNGDCVMLDEEQSGLEGGTFTPDEINPAFSGPLAASFRNPLVLTDLIPAPGGSTRTVDVDLHWRRTGPISRTVTDSSTEESDSFLVSLTAPMKMTGTIDWVHLGDPRVHGSVVRYERATIYYRPAS